MVAAFANAVVPAAFVSRDFRTPRPRAALLGGAVLVVLLLLAGLYALRPWRVAAPAGQAELRGQTIRLLVVGDPFAAAIEKSIGALQQASGARLLVETVGYDDLRRLILRGARDAASSFDIVAFDVVWMGELVREGVLLPLAAGGPAGADADRLPIAVRQARHGEYIYGVPVQPHPELLWARRDLLETQRRPLPATTAELLETARLLTKPAENQYGICWNGQRGQALGQQMAHYYAAFGQRLLDAQGRPQLDTPAGLAAARYAQALLKYSPPDILNMAWDQRVRSFARGTCAMTYEWAARSPTVEHDPLSRVAGRVAYGAAPHAATAAAVTPMGTWSLGIPANIGARRALAEQALYWLTAAPQQRLLAQHGNAGMPRLSLLADTELARRYPAFEVIARLQAAGELDDWMRPAVPEWAELADVLGTVFHDMLGGMLTAEAATQLAQQRALALWEARRAVK
jgi:multiple sugar transport system substrate-binding protein